MNIGNEGHKMAFEIARALTEEQTAQCVQALQAGDTEGIKAALRGMASETLSAFMAYLLASLEEGAQAASVPEDLA